MARDILLTPIEYLKGVGPQRGKLLKEEAGIHTFSDLLDHFPFRYVDRSVFHRTRDLHEDLTFAQIKGTLGPVEEMGSPNKKRLVATIQDESGVMELVWFKGLKYIKPNLEPGTEYVAFGRPNLFKSRWSMPHPELTRWSEFQKHGQATQEPVYPSSEKLTAKGLNSKGIAKLQRTLLEQLEGSIPEVLPSWILEEMGLMSREAAYMGVHRPENAEQAKNSRFRLKFEELFFLQLLMAQQRRKHRDDTPGFPFLEVGGHFNRFYHEQLPFDLTGAQKRVLREIRQDTGKGAHMNRLLQGDVGSGKTLVALLAMLLAIDNGYQAALMAPTETLAQQHARTLDEMLAGMELRTALLTGSTKQKDRKPIHQGLQSGDIDILVGTHALIEETVQFHNLGIAVIDEQHRFGVAQRAKLWQKNPVNPPHVLVMTATPIPRTLAMTLYGDLDVSVIDELPPGRKPVRTVHRFESARLKVFGFLEEQIRQGKQIYVVYPLIEESEKMDYKNLMEGYEAITRRFPRPDYQVGVVHGRMDPAAKEEEMGRFARGETHILVSTTVIEVGVDVPNASVMVLESAERFGLSQLHQLRGRVGRGRDQAYCILMTGEELSSEGWERMNTMVRTNDGFEIADVDMSLRGPGDIGGTQQSGMVEFKIADITTDQAILHKAREYAKRTVEADPGLEKGEHEETAAYLAKLMQERPDWSRIS